MSHIVTVFRHTICMCQLHAMPMRECHVFKLMQNVRPSRLRNLQQTNYPIHLGEMPNLKCPTCSK